MDVLILIAAVAGFAWAGVFLLRGRLIDGLLLLLLTIACFGHAFLAIQGPLPLTIDRLVLGFLILACLVQRKLGLARRPRWMVCDVLVAGFIALLVASLAYGQLLGGETPPLPCFWQLFLGYGTPAAIYFLARHGRVDESQLVRVHAALAGFGVYLGLTGMFEIAKLWALVFPRYIADPTIGLHFGRARGPMIHSVSYGVYLCVALGAAWLLAWRSGLSRRHQALALATMPAILAGIYLSYTRSVWIGAGLAVMIVLSLTLTRRWRVLFWGTTLVGGALVAATQMDNLMGFKREFTEAETRDSAQVRQVFAYVSWLMFQDRPLLGVGMGQFRTSKLPYLADRETELRLQAIRDWVHHNNYLGILTETGLVGFMWFLTLLGSWVLVAVRGWRHAEMPARARSQCLLLLAVIGVWSAQLAFHELSFSPLDNSLVFFLAGLAVTAVEVYVPRAAGRPSPQPIGEEDLLAGRPSLRLRLRLLGQS